MINMESLLDYRHVVEKETKKVFVECIKKSLKEIKLKHIGFVGIIGSHKEKYSHDIDVLLFPSKDSKIGDTILEIGNFYNKINSIIKKHHERLYLALCPRKNMQEMVYYLSSLEEGGAGMIPVHSLFFPDYKSFKKFNPKGFEKEITKNLITLYGKFEVIKSVESLPQEKLEPYFILLDFEMNSKIKNFPRHLVRVSAESLFSYLRDKYSLKIKKGSLHNISEIEAEIRRIVKELDKLNYS